MSHPSPLAAAAHRALALRDAGDLSAARELLAEAVGAARRTYGEDHPDVLNTAHLLSRFHREADDPMAARRVLEEAYAAGERRWDPSDPLMLAISYDLAGVAEELGNRHEARRNYARVANAGPAVLGEDHPAVRTARRYLGHPDPVPAPAAAGPVAPDQGAMAALSGPTMAFATLPPTRRPTRPTPPPVAAPSGLSPAAPSGPSSLASPAPAPAAAPRPAPVAPPTPVPATSPGPAPMAPPGQPPSARSVPAPMTSSNPSAGHPGHPARPPGSPVSAWAGAPGAAAPVSSPPASPWAPPQPPASWTADPATTTAPPQPSAPAATTPPARPAAPPASPTSPASRAPGPPAPSPVPQTPGWDNPTVQVQQIGPLLEEEIARARAGAPDHAGAAGGQPAPVSPYPTQQFSAPPAPPTPVSAPPGQPGYGPAQPVSAPPGQPGYGPVELQPVSAPPISAPPGYFPPVSGPPGQPVSGPPGYPQQVSAPPVSAPPWGMTAPAWAATAPPQPLPTSDAAEAEPAEDVSLDADDLDQGLVSWPDQPATDTPGRETFDERGRSEPVTPGYVAAGVTSVGGAAPGTVAPVPSAHPNTAAPVAHPASNTMTQAPKAPANPNPPLAEGHRHTNAGQSHPAPAHYDTVPSQPHPAAAQAVTYPPVEPYRPPAPSAYPGQMAPSSAYSVMEEPASRGRSRAAVAVAVTAIGVAVAAVAGVGALVLSRDGTPVAGPGSSPVPAGPRASGPPPGDLELRDDSATITLSWTDPSGGTVPFMVAGGRTGKALGVMATVDPGQTSYTVNGLSARVDYCFTVLAVWSTDTFATSGQVCTDRERRTPSG